jgi:MraZ protein
MFLGSFNYSIDAKGRLSIPAKFKKYLNQEANETFVITRGLATCIDIYPLDYWRSEVLSRVDQLDDFNPEEASFKRLLLELASEDKLDSQSRLLVPKNLVEFARIERDVFILGQNKKIEVWNPSIYEASKKDNSKSYVELAQQVMNKYKT